MAWTSPRTWVAGEILTASLMNTHVRDNLSYLKTQVDLAVLSTTAVGAVSSVTTLSGGNNNDVSSPSTLIWRVDASAAVPVITGIASGSDGRLILMVLTAGSFTFSGEDGASSAANRIKSSSSTIAVGTVVGLVYQAGSVNRWSFVA